MQHEGSDDSDGFYVVPEHISDSDSDIEIIDIEPDLREASPQCFQSTEYAPSVFFKGMLDVYPVDSSIVAKLEFIDGFEKSPADKVILVPSAWRSVDEFVCVGQMMNNYVMFDVQDLPKTTNELYHLCYSSADKTVPGVSDAFSFQEVLQGEQRIMPEVGPTGSRISHIMNAYWNSLIENEKPVKPTDIIRSEVIFEDALMNANEESLTEDGTSSYHSEKLPETTGEEESKVEVQVVNHLMEIWKLQRENQKQADELEEKHRENENLKHHMERVQKSMEMVEQSLRNDLQEKTDECKLLEIEVSNLNSELSTALDDSNETIKHCKKLEIQVANLTTERNTTQDFVEYMISQKDERFGRMSSEARNAHKYVYETMKSRYGQMLGGFEPKDPISERNAVEAFYTEKIDLLEQSHERKINEIKKSQEEEIQKMARFYENSMEKQKESHEQRIRDLNESHEEKIQDYAAQLVYSKHRCDCLEKSFKKTNEEYETRLKCCAKEYARLYIKYQKLTAAAASAPINTYFSELRAKMKNIKIKSKKEDSK